MESKKLESVLFTGIDFKYNLTTWLMLLKLVKNQKERQEALSNKKFAVTIDGQRVMQLNESNKHLLKDNMQVTITLAPVEKAQVQSQEEATTEESKLNLSKGSKDKNLFSPKPDKV